MLPQTKTNLYFYLLIAFLMGGFTLFSQPFLKYPYDIFAHLIAIDEFYHGAETTTTSIQQGRLVWHDIWANIFHFLRIPSADMFLRAKVVYVIQTLFSFFSIYIFSKVILRNLFTSIDTMSVKLLSLWSAIIWVSIFATFSVHYHLVWTLWYGVNYQITLPLFFYITALSLILVYENNSKLTKIFYIFQIIFISIFIVKVHAMEFMYYLMYLSLLGLLYINKVYTTLKKYYYMLLPLLVVTIYLLQNILSESSKIFYYLKIENISQLYETILTQGQHVVEHLNRANHSMNELIYVNAILALSTLLFSTLYAKKYINTRLFIFIFITSFFVFIPLNVYSSGIFSLIARPDVIHRIYYSSSIFVMLPITIYLLIKYLKISSYIAHLFIFLILIGTVLYSKYSQHASHNYYKNIMSITNSFTPELYDFNLGEKEISKIGELLNKIEHSNEKIYYIARSDIAFVLKYIYHRKVFWKGRRVQINTSAKYQQIVPPKGYKKVLFETPTSFPKYIPYK